VRFVPAGHTGDNLVDGLDATSPPHTSRREPLVKSPIDKGLIAPLLTC
jgi:hypothetical protein